MPYQSMPWPSGCWLRAECLAYELAPLLEQGTALCTRWEALAQAQWAALEDADLAELALVQTGQLQLMHEFQMWAARCGMVLAKASGRTPMKVAGSHAGSSSTDNSDPALASDLTGVIEHPPPGERGTRGPLLGEQGQKFLAAAQRVAALNRRNARAFAALLSVISSLEMLVCGYRSAYGPDGAPASDKAPLSMGFDRQG
jgi:hypothetical protein